MHENSTSRWRFRHSPVNELHITCLVVYVFYLVRKCCLPKFQIFLSISQNSLEGTSQKFFIEVLGCPHQG